MPYPLENKNIHKIRGFTLVEILVALFIFAIISVMTAIGIRRMINTQQRISTATTKISKLQLAMTLLERDLEAISPHRLKNSISTAGSLLQMQGGGITFVTANNINPAMLADRGILRKVSYNIKGDKLIRTTWPVADPTRNTPSTNTTILDKVKRLQFIFIDTHGQVIKYWPPSNITQSIITTIPESSNTSNLQLQNQQTAPKGIEIVITVSPFGTIRRLFALDEQFIAKIPPK